MAQTLNTPDVLTQPIAQNGDKNIIPNTNDPLDGEMSQSLGFPQVCSERIADGGKAPRRADVNGAFNLISQQHFFFQNGGMNTFRQDVSNAIGGYPLNARLWYTDSNNESVIVRSLIQNNTFNFNTDPSYIDGIHWIVELENGGKVGTIFAYAGNTPPSGWLVCDGAEISRTSYARLFSVIGTTYGSGNGSTTFNIPDFVDKTFWGGTNSGTVKTAGLPNITGTFSCRDDNNPNQLIGFSNITGCFEGTNKGTSTGISGESGNHPRTLNFDASRSSSVFGGSTTVQPPAVQTLVIIKY